MNLPGLLLAFEGLDGAGKSTLIHRTQTSLLMSGFEAITTSEPTHGAHGTRLRQSAMTGRLPAEEELELFILDRKEHVAEIIEPALKRGAVVLLDRYYLSTAAYQGARGLDVDDIMRRNEAFAPIPDLALLLDMPAERCLERITRRGTADAFEEIAMLRRVRSAFLSLQRPWIRLIDADRPPEQVYDDCSREVADRIHAWGTALSGRTAPFA